MVSRYGRCSPDAAGEILVPLSQAFWIEAMEEYIWLTDKVNRLETAWGVVASLVTHAMLFFVLTFSDISYPLSGKTASFDFIWLDPLPVSLEAGSGLPSSASRSRDTAREDDQGIKKLPAPAAEPAIVNAPEAQAAGAREKIWDEITADGTESQGASPPVTPPAAMETVTVIKEAQAEPVKAHTPGHSDTATVRAESAREAAEPQHPPLLFNPTLKTEQGPVANNQANTAGRAKGGGQEKPALLQEHPSAVKAAREAQGVATVQTGAGEEGLHGPGVGISAAQQGLRVAQHPAAPGALPPAAGTASRQQHASRPIAPVSPAAPDGASETAWKGDVTREVKQAEQVGKETVAHKASEPTSEPKGLIIPSLYGDLKMVFSGRTGLRVSVFFREYPKSRRNRAQTRAEAKRGKRMLPVVAQTGHDTAEAIIETAQEGIYTFSAESKQGETAQATFTLKLFEGSTREQVAAIGSRIVAGKTVLVKVLMPEGIVWDDDTAFTGSLEDSNSTTKFNAHSGLYWKECKD